jgi:hypothetical protein
LNRAELFGSIADPRKDIYTLDDGQVVNATR